MKLFVIMYGLMAFVPQDKGVTVLMLDSSGLHYVDGTQAPEHTATVQYLTPDANDSGTANVVLELAGEDLLVETLTDRRRPEQVALFPGNWKGVNVSSLPARTVERAFIQARRLTTTDEEARVRPECLATPAKWCAALLNGRVFASGTLTMFPIQVMRNASGEWDRPLPLSRDVWALRDPVNKRRLGTYEGEFSLSVGLVGEVAAASTTEIDVRFGGQKFRPLTVAASSAQDCAPYLRAIDDSSADVATCFLLKVANVVDDDPGDRSHLPLLDNLALQKMAQPPEFFMQRAITPVGSQGPGNPHSDPCAGKIMLPW